MSFLLAAMSAIKMINRESLARWRQGASRTSLSVGYLWPVHSKKSRTVGWQIKTVWRPAAGSCAPLWTPFRWLLSIVAVRFLVLVPLAVFSQTPEKGQARADRLPVQWDQWQGHESMAAGRAAGIEEERRVRARDSNDLIARELCRPGPNRPASGSDPLACSARNTDNRYGRILLLALRLRLSLADRMPTATTRAIDRDRSWFLPLARLCTTIPWYSTLRTILPRQCSFSFYQVTRTLAILCRKLQWNDGYLSVLLLLLCAAISNYFAYFVVVLSDVTRLWIKFEYYKSVIFWSTQQILRITFSTRYKFCSVYSIYCIEY